MPDVTLCSRGLQVLVAISLEKKKNMHNNLRRLNNIIPEIYDILDAAICQDIDYHANDEVFIYPICLSD